MAWRVAWAGVALLIAAGLSYRASRPQAVERIGAWVRDEHGNWLHRPWWKVAINSALRSLQPWSRRLVVYTRCARGGSPPRVTGYGIGPVRHRDAWWLPQTMLLAYLTAVVVTMVCG